ncbi:MAG: NYN domain-containing protein [Aquabacterium sp.]|uniref:NYN domain-containing protein n=1 Tax=Aquabacterium sp. TaxID=1872578 RepID=UPI0025B86644|nr:NYN domain-containing protein [Aquabacterium sp.]MBI3381107.1 NYN domain-containing protein [Aquabacterium sp.]
MALPQDNISMALFCDFENVALGVRDANYDKFDIKRVLERLLLKGSIVVKKAYCDWERYKGFKAAMHEANFELIEIPHVRQSGKNSADIRLVVDALDLCYTKSHVNTFVIISGDSDFSPLVSKLRENAKYVIGVGVKNSTSDLLIANCDEFIFYDDLVRESQRQAARQGSRDQPQQRRSPEEDRRRREEMDKRRTKAVEMAAETYEALVTDRDEGGRVWASVLKEAIKRRNPGFNENYYGFRTFGNLLEEAQQRGLLEFGRDEKSGAYVSRGSGQAAQRVEPVASPVMEEVVVAEVIVEDSAMPVHHVVPTGEVEDAIEVQHPASDEAAGDHGEKGRGRQRGDRKPAAKKSGQRGRGGRQRGEASAASSAPSPTNAEALSTSEAAPAAPKAPKERQDRRGRATQADAPPSAPAPAPAPAPAEQAAATDKPAAKKAASRPRRPRKPAAKQSAE